MIMWVFWCSRAADGARLYKDNVVFDKRAGPLALFWAVLSVLTQQATFWNEGIAEKNSRFLAG